MSIPNLAQPIFTGDGVNQPIKANPNFTLMLQQLITALQSTISDEGFRPAQLDATTIAQLNTAASIGAMVFNKTAGKFMGNETGTFRTFTTS